jgi:hypothetical protein
VLHGLGRIEEWLAAVKGMDGLAGGTQFENLIANLHDVGESDFVETIGDAHCAPFGCHAGPPARTDVLG